MKKVKYILSLFCEPFLFFSQHSKTCKNSKYQGKKVKSKNISTMSNVCKFLSVRGDKSGVNKCQKRHYPHKNT